MVIRLNRTDERNPPVAQQTFGMIPQRDELILSWRCTVKIKNSGVWLLAPAFCALVWFGCGKEEPSAAVAKAPMTAGNAMNGPSPMDAEMKQEGRNAQPTDAPSAPESPEARIQLASFEQAQPDR